MNYQDEGKRILEDLQKRDLRMQKIIRFVDYAVFTVGIILLAAVCAHCQTQDIVLPRPQGQFIVAGRSIQFNKTGGAGDCTKTVCGMNSNWIFQTLYAQETTTVTIYNKSTSNTNNVALTVAIANDPSTNSYQGNTSRWTGQTVISTGTSVGQGAIVQFSFQTSGAAKIVMIISGTNSDSSGLGADMTISQSQTVGGVTTTSVATGNQIIIGAINPSSTPIPLTTDASGNLNVDVAPGIDSFTANASGPQGAGGWTSSTTLHTTASLSFGPSAPPQGLHSNVVQVTASVGSITAGTFSLQCANANGVFTNLEAVNVATGQQTYFPSLVLSSGAAVYYQFSMPPGCFNEQLILQSLITGAGTANFNISGTGLSTPPLFVLGNSSANNDASGQLANQALATEKGARWSIASAPSAGAQATGTNAAITSPFNVAHVIDCISFSATAGGAVTAGNANVVVRDSTTGAGTVLYSQAVSFPTASAAGVQEIVPFQQCGLAIQGTPGNAMTCEFTGSQANVMQAVNCSGYLLQ